MNINLPKIKYMEGYRFVFAEKLSKSSVKNMIADFAKHGNHTYANNFSNEAEIRVLYSRIGVNFDELVEKCRDPKNAVIRFENLLTSEFTTHGASIEKVNFTTGETKSILKGDGVFSEAGYWTAMEKANSAFLRSVDEMSHYDYLNAVVLAIASIEAYVNHRVAVWNRINKNDQFIDDEKHKVSLEDKLKHWVPKMSKTKGIDMQYKTWERFKELKKARDRQLIHSNDANPSITFKDFVRKLNQFKDLPHFLFQLHVLFKERVPGVIIRMKHMRNIELISIPSGNDDKPNE